MRLPNVLWFFVVLITLPLLAIIIPKLHHHEIPTMRIVCEVNLKVLSKAIRAYADDYEAMLPAEDWCDLLIEKADVAPKSFVCPCSDVIEGESSYVMNKNVAGKKLNELPDDIVLIFETDMGLEDGPRNTPIETRKHAQCELMKGYYDKNTLVYKERFNQIGGPEDAFLSYHERGMLGCNVAFVDGHTEFVTEDRIADLKWTAD